MIHYPFAGKREPSPRLQEIMDEAAALRPTGIGMSVSGQAGHEAMREKGRRTRTRVIELQAKGMDADAIAAELGLAKVTVRNLMRVIAKGLPA